MKIKKSNKNSSSMIKGLDDTYVGPITVPKGPSKVTSMLVNRSLANNILSSGTGIVTNVFSIADVVAVQDWADLQNIWKEYRVLAMELEFIPISASTSIPICLAIVGDHNHTLGSLSSMNDAVSYDNVDFITSGAGALTTTGKFKKYSIRASGVDELTFVDINAAPSSQEYGVKTYSTVGTNSVVYFEVIQKFTLEFRGSG